MTYNTALTTLWCEYNLLTALDVTKNTELFSLECHFNLLTILDVTNNTALYSLYCYSNRLTFATLPSKQTTWATYFYSPQSTIALPKKNFTLSETIDLSSQLTANGNTTSYIWKTKGGTTLAAETDYSITNGVTTFLKVQTDSVYCQMSNATFPSLTLSTTNVKVTQFPTSIDTELNGLTNVYPNPVSNLLWVECEEQIRKVEIYTILGAKVLEQDFNNAHKANLNTSELPKGFLIVKVYGVNGVMEKKILKE